MLQTFIEDTKLWLKQPYNENGNALQWFLFIGFMAACTFLWAKVIRRILD